MKSIRWMFSYILVASLGLWLAFAMSMKFMTPARSQQAPDSGELPAEFMKESEPVATPPQTAQPPAAVTEPPAAVPPPPADLPSNPPVMAEENPSPPPMEVIFKSDYVYDPTGKRDPFKPFKAIGAGPVKPGRAAENLEPLQRWELERLQVVGILWDVAKPKAMIKDPDGTIYTASIKTKIGRNDGFIAAIREGEIVVIELTYYEDGRTVQEPRILELKK